MTGALRILGAAMALLGAGLIDGLDPGAATGATVPAAVALRTDEGWHSEPYFEVSWELPALRESGHPAAAVHYRLRHGNGGTAIAERRVGYPTDHLPITVPLDPDRYTIEVWIEDSAGLVGPPAQASLRYDPVPPGPSRPLALTGWISPDTAPLLRLEHPAAPLPLSGIRGYAVSVDGNPQGSPCAERDRCSTAETDLSGGIDDDVIRLGALPAGTSFVHVVAISGAGVRSNAVGTVPIHVDAQPPAVTLSGAPDGWSRGPVRLTATAADALAGMAVAGPNGPFTELAIDGELPISAAGAVVSTVVSGDGVHRMRARARDAAGNLGESGRGPLPALVRIDESAPAVAFVNGQDGGDPERIEATVADPLSGPDPGRGTIAVRPVGSRRQFLPLVTTVAAGRLVARWDSDAFADGTYEFRASGYDLAGNAASGERRANGTRMVLANPLKRRTEIVAGFGRGRSAHRSVRFGHGALLGGRLRNAAGAPLGGLPVQVVERFDAGSEPRQRTTTVLSGSDGAFLAHLAPGPSREVEALFEGSPVLGRSSGKCLWLGVRAGVRMHASSGRARIGGAPIVFSGRVASDGAALPAGGVPVELQFRFGRGGWREFRTVQSDRRGRFRYPYAFSDDDSRGVRFQFRALVAAQGDWPYEAAGSRPVLVTGR